MVGGQALDVHSMQVRRSQRGRIPNDIYTPDSKQDTTRNVSYKLNGKTALQKKALGTSKSQKPINVQDKSGTFIIENLSSAAYKLLKRETYDYYNKSDTNTIQEINSATTIKGLKTKVNVEQALSVKRKSGGRQLYRINFFNTNNKIDVNGYKYKLFVDEDFPKIREVLRDTALIDQLNQHIYKACISVENNCSSTCSEQVLLQIETGSQGDDTSP
ncbi:hypothetical protein DPMN_113478 [Dreissena polymorpha]|uniref:Uncharacterized protein n=1 Tax=Dreissena polymorpha TaxID=45954 RepID=A0A9D4KI09_DREPO|nr:hypothetical protein DPMN_113478 [Dreissena polymorpha]